MTVVDHRVGLDKILAAAGDNSDRVAFTEHVKAELSLRRFRTGVPLRTHGAASWSKSPKHVNVMLGGYDDTGAELYWMDYMGTLQKINFGAHGHCSTFSLSLMDRHWKVSGVGAFASSTFGGCYLQYVWVLCEWWQADMCVKQLGTRFLLNQKEFAVKIVDESGIRKIAL